MDLTLDDLDSGSFHIKVVKSCVTYTVSPGLALLVKQSRVTNISQYPWIVVKFKSDHVHKKILTNNVRQMIPMHSWVV